MKKLKLDLETVEVHSFETTGLNAELVGTVHGEQWSRSLCGVTCGLPSCCHTAPEQRVPVRNA